MSDDVGSLGLCVMCESRSAIGLHDVGRPSRSCAICEDCRDDLTVCSNCNLTFFSDDTYFFDYDDCSFCNACEETVLEECDYCSRMYYSSGSCWGCDGEGGGDDGDRYVEGIHEWGYKPYPYFHTVHDGAISILHSGHQGSALYVGCELETESTHGDRADNVGVWRGFDFFYLKNDCSLQNGYEIVSHPATLGAWELLRDGIAQRFDEATSQGVRAWTRSRCGLHFHLSKASFTPSHVVKFHKFIMENSSEFIRFAGRNSAYGSFYADRGLASDRAKGEAQPSRGCAINYYNDNTIELRFFRPTLDVEGFFGIVQFVFAVYEYTKQLSARELLAGGGAFPFSTFVDWLVLREDYSDAYSRIFSRVLCGGVGL